MLFDTTEFYQQSCDQGFVKVEAIARNVAWTTASEWGDLQITINLSKPEKDPRDIAAAAKAGKAGNAAAAKAGDEAAAKTGKAENEAGKAGNEAAAAKARNEAAAARNEAAAAKAARNEATKAAGAESGAAAEKSYIDPATGAARPCPLCVTDHDVEIGYARPVQLGGEKWGMWYSPYAYYNEHCIAMSWQHRPMHIDRSAFSNLFDFIDLFPHYFIGSNADLPIVGGSILSHDHFQGGRHTFPMEVAPIAEPFSLTHHPNVEAGVVKWPLSVVRLRSKSREELVDAACEILQVWRDYGDPQVGIVPFTGDVRHNTITPIARMNGDAYEMDLALRCNITSDEHPLGVFHPHEELHHIKKENIGLIEVMGLAILPPRVRQVMEERGLSRDDVGRAFGQVLEHAGVFKWNDAGRDALRRFLSVL